MRQTARRLAVKPMLGSLGAAVLAAFALQAQAAEAPYYNPANPASSSGKTTDYGLYKTIGCPGRGILEAPCKEPGDTAPATFKADKPAPTSAAKPTPAPKDSDRDGVLDAQDQCPDTPLGRTVDARGCELDGDRDGVVDALDRCPTTPPGQKVNAQGCEPDSDGDGILDSKDQCPATPAGAKVDAKGCELDSDGDGVVDRLDRCPDTPRGTPVDAQGCALDSDGDGVLDAKDQCPNTVKGAKVDSKGCELPKVIILRGVNFDTNSAAIRPDAVGILDRAVATLKANPGLKVEVAGHTDSDGGDDYNMALSERRARAVLDYFVGQGVDASRLTWSGYGETQPIADNATEAGRQSNRRVELRTLN